MNNSFSFKRKRMKKIISSLIITISLFYGLQKIIFFDKDGDEDGDI